MRSIKAYFGIFAITLSLASQAAFAAVEDFENPPPGAVKWKVIDYNRIQTHPARVPYKVPGGIAFDFLNRPDTAQLGTSHPSYQGDLIGNMTGKMLSATVGVTVLLGTIFTYYGQPDPWCNRPADVRFYFQTDTSGKFEQTDYWWSNPVSIRLQDPLLTDLTMSELMADGSKWSHSNGGFSNDPAFNAKFNAAVADVKFVGLSFGGGCFFANGVGVANGSGSFRLMDFSATP